MYKLNKVCTWSSRIGHFESSRIRCSQKHKHTHTLPSFSWEWVLNITHNRIRRSKFNQTYKQWLTHTRLLSFIHSMYYYYSSIFNLYKFRHEKKKMVRDIIMCIVFLSLVFRRRHGLTSGNDECGWEISRYAHHHRIDRKRRAAIIYTLIHPCIQKLLWQDFIYIYI